MRRSVILKDLWRAVNDPSGVNPSGVKFIHYDFVLVDIDEKGYFSNFYWPDDFIQLELLL